MNGVWGKVLKVDLSNGTCKAEVLPERVFEYFLGGAGLAAYYLWKECPAGTTAFNPANRLTFAGGPMTGIKQTGAAKWTAGAISPSFNLNADSAATASFGIEMKRTGFDAIVVHGRAEKPVYLVVDGRESQAEERPEDVGQGRLRYRGYDQRFGRGGGRGCLHRPGRGATRPLCEYSNAQEVLPRAMRPWSGDGIQAFEGDRGSGVPGLSGSRPG